MEPIAQEKDFDDRARQILMMERLKLPANLKNFRS